MSRWPRGEHVKVGLRRAAVVESFEVRFGKDFVSYCNLLKSMCRIRVVGKFAVKSNARMCELGECDERKRTLGGMLYFLTDMRV